MTARKKSNLGRQRQEQPVANPAAKLFKTKEADLFKLQTRIPRDMRPMRQVHTTTDPTGRRLTTRHVVRGHWTHQPYGPARSLRRLQWVAPFIRGPEGAPFVGTDTVTVWRR